MGRVYDLHYGDDSLVGKVGIDLSEARYDLQLEQSGKRRWLPKGPRRGNPSYSDIRGTSPLRGL